MNSLKEIMRSPDGGPTPQPVNDNTPPALLFEMIRSFVTMARVLNLSRAVTELKSTRQTVRRHISALEEAMNTDLFVLTDRQYELTETGRMALPDAQDILARGTTWLRGQSFSEGHLQRLAASGEGWDFRQQQQPLGAIWSDPSILLRETFRAWAMSSGQIESSLFSHVRPFLIIYRKTEAGWICVEFGEESVYVNWFGRDFARSSVGRQLRQMPAGEEFSHLLFQAFEEVQATQTARLDHVLTSMPRAGRGVEPVVFQRLIMHGFFPDGSPAVQSLVVPVAEPNLHGVESEWLKRLDPPLLGEFSEEDALFERFTPAG